MHATPIPPRYMQRLFAFVFHLYDAASLYDVKIMALLALFPLAQRCEHPRHRYHDHPFFLSHLSRGGTTIGDLCRIRDQLCDLANGNGLTLRETDTVSIHSYRCSRKCPKLSPGDGNWKKRGKARRKVKKHIPGL